MKYVEKNYLEQRGSVNQAEPKSVPTFMVGENYLARWEDGYCRHGSDINYIFPTFTQESGRGFLIESTWSPAEGSCASGTDEILISFEEGVKILCEHGIYPWLKDES